MDAEEGLIRRLWLRFLWVIWDYEPTESESDDERPRPLGKAFLVLASGILLSVCMARHFGGLCNQVPIYIAIAISCGTLVMALGLAQRGYVLVFIFLVGISSIFLVFKAATSAKSSLYSAGLDSDVGLSEGVVTRIETYSATDTEYYTGQVRGWKLYFSYVVNGAPYDQCDILSQSDIKIRDIKIGDDVKVLYLVGRPQIARSLKADELR